VPVEVEPGILRVTLPLPTGPRHVHCYLLRGDGGWTLVDTGLGLPETPWSAIAAELDAPIVRIFVTHMHPDHVGGAEAAAAATGAPVLQGRLDYAQCERVWGSDDWPRRIADWFLLHGVPPAAAEELIESGHVFADFVRFAWNPELVEPGDEVDGWRVLATPGHADGHLCLLREDVLVAGDHVLTPITPASTRRAVPTRSATTSSRSGSSRGWHRASRTAATVIRWPTRPGARRRSPRTTSTGWTRPLRRSAKSRGPATSSPTRCSGASSRRSSAASPSPRRSPTSSVSSRSGGRSAMGTTVSLPILRRSWWTSSRLVPAPSG